MIRGKSGVSLDLLTEALETEILNASESEVRDLLRENTPRGDVAKLRALVARAVDEALHTASPPPIVRPDPALRRP